MDLKIKRLTDTAIMPTRGSAGAAAIDLYADSIEGSHTYTEKNGIKTVEVRAGQTVKVKTGLSMAIPKGYVGLIFPRSGLAVKKNLRLANCVGVIDEDYRGEVMVVLHADPTEGDRATFSTGDRIAQMVFVKYDMFNIVETDELDETSRGAGGFGSTGR